MTYATRLRIEDGLRELAVGVAACGLLTAGVVIAIVWWVRWNWDKPGFDDINESGGC